MTTFQTANDSLPHTAPLQGPGPLRQDSWLDRLKVGQKLALMALMLGVPVIALSASQLSQGFQSRGRSVAELRGLDNFSTLAALQSGLYRFTAGHVEGQLAASQAGFEQAETGLDALLARPGAQSADQLQSLRTAWQSLQEYARTRDSFTVINNFQTLVQTQQLPLTEALLSDAGFDLERSPVIDALLLSSKQASVLTRQLQLLSLDATLLREPTVARLESQLTQRNLYMAADALASYQIALGRAFALAPELKTRSQLGELSGVAIAATQQALDLTEQTLNSGIVTPALLQAYSTGLTSLEKSTQTTVLDLERQIRERLQRDSLMLGLLTALVLGLLLGAGALLLTIIRRITQPIRALTLAAQDMEQGRIAVQVPVTSADELGTLSRAFNTALSSMRRNQEYSEFQLFEAAQLQQHVSEFLEVTTEIASGDMTRRGQVTADILGNVVDSINLMTEELALILSGVRDASVTVTGGSQAVTLATAQIEDGTRTTSQEAAQIAQLAQELTQGIRTMSAVANASAEASRRALAASEQGQQAVQGTLQGMSAIRQSAQDAETLVQTLARRSEEIGEIAESVAHLASQVNLLSLHASIEAAGAGPAGARFAVVAEEVRLLADESTVAGSRIGALINDLRSDIQQVSDGIRATSAHVEQGYVVADSAGSRLREVSELAGITAQLAQTISVATARQVQGVSRMSQGTRQIASVASTSQESAAQAREAAERLEALAVRLDRSLARFRLA